jgi:exportin-1
LIPPELDLCAAYAQGADSDQKFIANLAMFLAAFLKEHANLVEVTPNDRTTGVAAMKQQVQGAHTLVCLCFTFNSDCQRSYCVQAMDYLLKISRVDEVEVFKITLDFWSWLCGELYRECPFLSVTGMFFYLFLSRLMSHVRR